MSTPTAKDKHRKNQIIAILIIAAIALLGFNIYLWMSNQSNIAVIDTQEKELALADDLMKDLDVKYQAALSDLDSQKGTNEELNNVIEEQKEELKKLKMKIERQIRNGKSTRNELEQARGEISRLTTQSQAYLQEIDQLKTDLNIKEEENTVLKSQKEQLEQTVNAVENQKAQVESEKAEVEKEKEMLASKVEIGKVLKVASVNITPMKLKSNGEEKEVKYAKRTDRLKACFDIVQNRLTDGGRNKFLVRYIDPLGSTIKVDAKGSGTFANQSAGGTQTPYTTSYAFDYDNGSDNICVDWDQDIQLSAGEYTVEIYNKGYLVGEGKFLLK